MHWHQCLHLCDLYWLPDSTWETSTNKWLHHFVHATLYTTTLIVYQLLTTSTNTLYWNTTNPVPHTSHGHLALFCIGFWRSPLIRTLVLFIFTLTPLVSTLSFHSLSLSIRSSSVSAPLFFWCMGWGRYALNRYNFCSTAASNSLFDSFLGVGFRGQAVQWRRSWDQGTKGCCHGNEFWD